LPVGTPLLQDQTPFVPALPISSSSLTTIRPFLRLLLLSLAILALAQWARDELLLPEAYPSSGQKHSDDDDQWKNTRFQATFAQQHLSVVARDFHPYGSKEKYAS
jgi:hypothetical protein